MIRQALRGAMIVAAIALLFEGAIGQQPGPVDRVVVRDKKDGTLKNYDGTLKFAAAGFQIANAEGKIVATVSPVDIVKVVPGELVGVERAAVLAQLTLEDKKTRKDYEMARTGYTDMLQKAASAPPRSKQYLMFKKVSISTKILDDTEDDEWVKMVEPVAKEWNDFLSEYKSGWEIWLAARTSARLGIELNKYGEIERLWKRMAGKDYELPVDLKTEATLQMIDAQIRGGPQGYATALLAAEAEGKNTSDAAAKEKLAIYARAAKVGDSPAPDVLNEAVKDIEQKIAATKFPSVREVGYGMIGELYLASKRPRDAMWAFLWVETVYNQDKDDVLKAMVRLTQIFKTQMDEDREKSYREKIRRLRQQL